MSNPALQIFNPTSQQWERYPLNRQDFSVGRTDDNDLMLDNPLVSRQHARLHLDGRGVWIMDLNSSNGVLVNNARIQPGQWVLLPAGAAINIGQTTLHLELASQPAQPAPQTSRKKIWLPVLGVFGIALCVCLAAAGGVAAWKYYPRLAGPLPGQTAQTESQEANLAPTAEPLNPPQSVETLPVSAGGPAVQDSHGVSVEIPAAVLPQGQAASLESASFSHGMQQELEKAYTVESLAYSVSAVDQDGMGQVKLSLPAPSADSRLAVLIDEKYAGVLDIEPQNGLLQVDLFLGAPLQASSAPTETLFIASNRYFVVTPKTGASLPSLGNNLWVSFPAQADSSGGKSCITEFWLQSHCWRNQEGTVYVFWEDNVPGDLKETEYLRIEDMINAVAEIMRAYNQDYHFNNAAISKSNPVYIIIDPSEPEPTYSQKTGNVYLNWSVVGSITSQENHCALAHELMHWTEDSAYTMNAAAVSNSKAWWLEMAAENGSFMIDPACIDRNLATYGRAVTNGNLLPLQSESLVWNRKEGARYIQALQVYGSLCSGGANCAMSQDQFVAAINGGSYPFDDAGVLSAYQRSAKDMGLFLMGKHPAEANVSAHLPPSTQEGGAFAEYIWLKAVPSPKMEVSDNGKQIQSTGSVEAAVNASIAQGGEYPLWVSNGKGMPGNTRAGYTSLPAMLIINAGTKLWYELDNGEAVFHDGGKELTLGPLSDKLGTGLVRLVAVAPDAAATFTAKVKPVDLSGDWLAQLSNPSVNILDCPSSTDSDTENGFDTSEVSKLEMLAILSSYGTYVADPAVSDGSHLIWQGTLPEGATAESDITIKPEVIEVKYRIDIPKPENSGLLPPWLAPKFGQSWPPRVQSGARLNSLPGSQLGFAVMAGTLLLALAWLFGAPRIKTYREGHPAISSRAIHFGSTAVLSLALLVGAVWLSGCVGFGIWGSFDGTITFNKLEYIDPEAPASAVSPAGETLTGLTWKLHEGKEVNNLDIFVEVSSTDADGNETSEVQECKFSVTSSADGFIGPADMVILNQDQ
jgi:hypothetical protein